MVAVAESRAPSRESTRHRTDKRNLGYTPVDLDSVPEVGRFLRELGVGDFQRDSVTAPVGRNDTWAGVTESGRKVFVKRLEGPPEDVAARMRRMLSFERLAGLLRGTPLHSPVLLGSDPATRLVAFEYIESGVSGARLMVDETFHDGLAAAAGEAIAALHEAEPPDGEELDRSPPVLPALLLRPGVALQAYQDFSYAEIEVWRLLQGDPRLLEAIARLCVREAAAPKVPAHCDLRVDQFIIVRDRVHITDWEEFRLADGARDVGAFAGEWLYRSVLDIVTSRGDSAFVDLEFDHRTVLRRGAEKIERLRPKVEHFWRAYLRGRERIDDEFAERAAAFAGWHMLDRMIAGSPQRGRISGIEKAAAGIGRKILLEPGRFAATIGLGAGK